MRTFSIRGTSDSLASASAGAIGAGVDVVILAGTVGVDAPWTFGVPRPLLPLPGMTVLEMLVRQLRKVYKGTCTICANGRTERIAGHVARDASLASGVWFYEDAVPRGTAGCIKACESGMSGETTFVAGGSVWLEDDPLWMLHQHRTAGNALTIFCTPGASETGNGERKPAGLFCCDRTVLDHIPEVGFVDLKEQLVPTLQRAGLRVGAVTLQHGTREVVDWPTYQYAVGRALSSWRPENGEFRESAPGIWCGQSVEIEPRARVVGPAFLGHGCKVHDDAVVVGPAMLGDGSRVGPGSWLIRVVAPHAVQFPAASILADRFVPVGGDGPAGESVVGISRASFGCPRTRRDGLSSDSMQPGRGGTSASAVVGG